MKHFLPLVLLRNCYQVLFPISYRSSPHKVETASRRRLLLIASEYQDWKDGISKWGLVVLDDVVHVSIFSDTTGAKEPHRRMQWVSALAVNLLAIGYVIPFHLFQTALMQWPHAAHF